MFRWFGFFCSRLCTTNSGCSRAKSRQAGFWRLSPLFRYRIEVVGKLVDDWGGTTRGSFPTDYAPAGCITRQRLEIVVSGERYLLTAVQCHTRVPGFRLPIGRDSRTLYRRAPPNQPKNFPARQPPLSKPKKFADRNGGCRAGKFGEMREVWRVGDRFCNAKSCQ